MPVDRIVEAALQAIDDFGLEALSMRSLATQLNSSTATLYRHFPTQAVLLGSVIDRVLGEADVDAAHYQSLGWRQGCETIAGEVFGAFRRHRPVALLLADHLPIGPNSAAVRERTLAIFINDGFEVPVAARAGAMIGHLIQGFAIQLGGERERTGSDREALRKAVRALDLTQYPAMAAVKKARWRPTAIDEEFSFALEMVLDGLSRLRG
jgi:TetR/AcrR family tetracycline transcriptional repressor